VVIARREHALRMVLAEKTLAAMRIRIVAAQPPRHAIHQASVLSLRVRPTATTASATRQVILIKIIVPQMTVLQIAILPIPVILQVNV